ncbi:putative TKL family protein kinase [Blattamonas nauphoetae]|uniref:TKL family protein kinase n=1 Tax=Blattamonas nauphoetae TaxID=2049346 RepID=A0ABQ9Y9Z2_9EUKA|nr:putative TKL family protein kinase [Blattamonas nauphoetae]
MGGNQSKQPQRLDPSSAEAGQISTKSEEKIEKDTKEHKMKIEKLLTKHNLLVKAEHIMMNDNPICNCTTGTIHSGTLNDEPVIIKMLSTPLVNDRAFYNELEEMISLSDRHILPLVGASLDPPILITPHLRNGDLRSRLYGPNKVSYTWEQKKDLLITVAKAVERIQSKSSKPHNLHSAISSPHILILDDGSPCLGGFGCSIRLRLLTPPDEQGRSPIKIPNLSWTPPEIIGELYLAAQSIDSYSFGILLYETACELEPYANISQKELIQHMLEDPIRPTIPDTLPYGTPEEVIDLIQACWSGIPEDRPTMPEIIKQLQKM